VRPAKPWRIVQPGPGSRPDDWPEGAYTLREELNEELAPWHQSKTKAKGPLAKGRAAELPATITCH